MIARSLFRSAVKRRGLRAPLFGALLALLAIVNIIGVSGWHSAMAMHDDAVVAADIVQHSDDDPSLPEIDLHKVSHGMIQGLADIAPRLGIASFFAPMGLGWFLGSDTSLPAAAPEGLLRPPRM